MIRSLRGIFFPAAPSGLSERIRSRFTRVSYLWLVLAASLTWIALSVYSSQADLVTYFSSILTVEYSHHFYAYLLDYPPGWVEASSLLGWGYSLFFPAATIFQHPMFTPAVRALIGGTSLGLLPAPAFVVSEKLVLLAADLLAGFVIYQLVLERSKDAGWAKLSLAAWLFNPLVLFESAVHGAYDILPAAFAVIAFYLALHQRYLSGGAALGLGIWLKLFPVFFIPVLVVVLWQVVGRRPRDFMKATALAAGGLGLVTAAVLWPPGLVHAWLFSLPSGIGNAFGGLGIWSFLSISQFASLKLWLYVHISQVIYGLYVAVSILVVLVAWRLLRNKTAGPNSPATHHALIVSAIVAPSAAATVHPQYLVWAVPFLAIVLWERREYVIPYLGISVAVVVYELLIHAGPLYWFQALAVDTRLLSPASLVRNFHYWTPREAAILPWLQIPIFTALLLTAIHSYRLIRQGVDS
jgi:Gpi18-like mannosyltransferase